jgi:hypothetical protein
VQSVDAEMFYLTIGVLKICIINKENKWKQIQQILKFQAHLIN